MGGWVVAAEAEDWILLEYAVIYVQGMEEEQVHTAAMSWRNFILEEGLDAKFLALSDF